MLEDICTSNSSNANQKIILRSILFSLEDLWKCNTRGLETTMQLFLRAFAISYHLQSTLSLPLRNTYFQKSCLKNTSSREFETQNLISNISNPRRWSNNNSDRQGSPKVCAATKRKKSGLALTCRRRGEQIRALSNASVAVYHHSFPSPLARSGISLSSGEYEQFRSRSRTLHPFCLG